MRVASKFLAVLLTVGLMFSCATTKAVEQEGVEHVLKVLHTNDHHGHPMAFYDYPAGDQGGLPAQATYVQGIRDTNENVLVLSAGDFNTGRPESNFFNAEPDILGFNYIGYDALTMGNHEYDHNWDDMQKQIAQSDFPWLSANVKKDGKYLDNVQPYIIKQYDGFKVAILGLTTSKTALTGSPVNIKGLEFLDEVEVAKELLPKLKKKADIVIALVHMGIYGDDNLEGSRRLAEEVPGFAMIVDGHTHTMMEEALVVNGTPIVQARQWGLYVGNATIKFMDGEVTGFDWGLDPINVQYRTKDAEGNKTYHYLGEEIAKDEALVSILKPYADKVDAVLSEVIGNATDVFLNDDSRRMETALGDLVSDSQVWFMEEMGQKVDFAFQNGGGIRATLAAGEIQKKTVYEVLPFDNSIAVVSLIGSDVIALFDKAATNVGHGAMPQVSKEVSLTINEADKTVEEVLINGEPIDPNRVYNIVANSYLASGGDGYKIFNNKTYFYDSSLMQRDALIDYVVSLGGDITPATDGRITIK